MFPETDACTCVSLRFITLDLLSNPFSRDGSLKLLIQEPFCRRPRLKSSDELLDGLSLISHYQKQPVTISPRVVIGRVRLSAESSKKIAEMAAFAVAVRAASPQS